jgi:hypothetical protein
MNHVTRDHARLIVAIVERAGLLGLHSTEQRSSLLMDLNACHANGCILDLHGLLRSGESDFKQDIAGIQRHINREAGMMESAEVYDPNTGKRSSVTFTPCYAAVVQKRRPGRTGR